MHLRQVSARLEEERRLSRRALDEAENRITQLEVNRRSLEGELQRLKMCANDKESENQILEDRCQNLCKQIQVRFVYKLTNFFMSAFTPLRILN
ncbi:unnamed protein product [Trichobilharzia regenti]|nr:unnamed protein product [Trichobilharzia regenti]